MSDYDKLVKALRHCAIQTCCDNCPMYDNGLDQDECVVKQYMDAATAIEALEAKVPHWVRCEDSVPEPHKNALFCGAKGGMFVGWTYGHGEDGVFRAFVHGGNARAFTHWMPLPEPPQEVQE